MSQRTATVLDRIVAETRVELERRKRERPLEDDVARCGRGEIAASAASATR